MKALIFTCGAIATLAASAALAVPAADDDVAPLLIDAAAFDFQPLGIRTTAVDAEHGQVEAFDGRRLLTFGMTAHWLPDGSLRMDCSLVHDHSHDHEHIGTEAEK